MRYRAPSLRTMVGATKAKRQIKKNLGVYEVTKVTNAKTNYVRKAKRRAGYESGWMKFIRFLLRLFK